MTKALLLLLTLLIFSCSDTENKNGNNNGNGNGNDTTNVNSQIAELFRLVNISTTEEIREELGMSFVREYIRDDGAVRVIYRNENGLQMRTLIRNGVELINRLQMDVEYWIEKNSINNVDVQFIRLQPHNSNDNGPVPQAALRALSNRSLTNVFPATRNEFINNFAQSVSEIYFEVWDSYGTEGAFFVSSPNLESWRIGMHIDRLLVICEEIGQFNNMQECQQYLEVAGVEVSIFDSIDSMASFAYADIATRLSGTFQRYDFTVEDMVKYFSNTSKNYRIFEFSQEVRSGIMRWGFWGHEIGTNHLVSFVVID